MRQNIELKTSRRSFWLWFLQRVSSVGLIIVLLVHMLAWHYINPPELTHVEVSKRLGESIFFATVEALLIGFVMFHALNGVRNVVYDYFPKPGTRKIVSILLLVVGIALFVWGTFVLFRLVFGG
ncbi:MAG: hypothetical protein JSV43_02015 [Methanobacteriota archaeon]|nr:MAG: hypothetical protein JSV43_02015 [Euryarchaeota archaeon]